MTSMYLNQVEEAARLMDEYVAYARSLGCEVVQDSILIDRPADVLKLSEWRTQRTGTRHG